MGRGVRPSWWGRRVHVAYTVVVFVILASLDNAALALIPSMIMPVTDALDTSEVAIGVMTATTILIVAVSAAGWGYVGDRRSRKRLLAVGTLIWAVGCALSATAATFAQLFVWQTVTAVGLGPVASVGFSVVSDFITPARRGLAMSFWGLSQGVGSVAGGILASQLGAGDFRKPLLAMAVLGLAFAALYATTFDVPRGFREPALEQLRGRGDDYEYRIEPRHLRTLADKRTNLWLVAQGLSAQFAYGSLIWVPLLYQEKVLAAGYDSATATKVGGLFAALFQVSGLFSIVAGHIGDRRQQRSPRGRAVVSTVGILGAVPFFVAFFFIPLRGLDVTRGGSTGAFVGDILNELVTNPWVLGAFLLALAAGALTSADSPNWFALISDVNLPEHRGTVFGIANLSNGVGRALGNGLTAAAARGLDRALPPPLNWAVGLAAFQVFFLPTGYCYWRAAGTSPGDIAATSEALRERAEGRSGRFE